MNKVKRDKKNKTKEWEMKSHLLWCNIDFEAEKNGILFLSKPFLMTLWMLLLYYNMYSFYFTLAVLLIPQNRQEVSIVEIHFSQSVLQALCCLVPRAPSNPTHDRTPSDKLGSTKGFNSVECVNCTYYMWCLLLCSAHPFLSPIFQTTPPLACRHMRCDEEKPLLMVEKIE